ncbi:MAG: 1-acyl-sn-glycerol-3-phosphate acyltransferase, partial [Pseudomonadota bacterium]
VLPVPFVCTVTFGAALRLEPDEAKEPFLARAADALLALKEAAA